MSKQIKVYNNVEEDPEYIKDSYLVLKSELENMSKISAYNDDVIWEEVDTMLECLKMLKRKLKVKENK